jgi:hypothetical protein
MPGTEIVELKGFDLPALFSAETAEPLTAVVVKIEKACLAEVFDMDDEKSRDACRSLAAKIARSKTTLESAGKKLSDDLRAKIAPINELRKLSEDRLDALKVKVRAPLTKWEAAEKDRIAEINATLETLRLIAGTIENASVGTCEETLERLKNIPADEDTFHEFAEIGIPLHADAMKAVEAALDAAQVREAEAAELEALRKEKADREAAALKVKEDAEAATKAKEVEAAAAAREKEIADAAAEAERQRIADQAEVVRKADEARAADVKHRQKVRRKILDAVREIVGLDIDQTTSLIEAIEEGNVPHVTIQY